MKYVREFTCDLTGTETVIIENENGEEIAIAKGDLKKPVVLFHKDLTKDKNCFEMLCEAGSGMEMAINGRKMGVCTPPTNYPFYLAMSDEDFENHMAINEQIEWVAL